MRRQGEEIRRLRERPPQERPQEGEVSYSYTGCVAGNCGSQILISNIVHHGHLS